MYGAELYSGVTTETTGAAGCLAAAVVGDALILTWRAESLRAPVAGDNIG